MIKNILNKLKKFSFFDTFKHASTYFSGTMLVHALGLVTLPIFTALMTPGEYGIVNVFTSYTSVIAVLLSFNLHWAISRYYFEKDKDDFDSFLGTIFIAVTIVYWGLSTIVLIFKNTLAGITNLPEHLFIWLIVMSYLLILYSFFDQLMIAQKRSKRYITIQVAWQYSKFACTVALLYYLADIMYFDGKEQSSYTYMGKIIGDCLATSAIVLYAFREVYKHMSFKNISWDYIRYSLSYSIPLIPFALSNYILTSFDQMFINAEVGHDEAGQYAFAYKIGMLYVGLGTALLNGSQPAYYKFMNKGQYKEVWRQVDSMTKLLALGGCFLILFAVDAGALLSSNDKFLKAISLAPIIIGGYVFHGVGSFYNRGIYYEKKNTYLAVIIFSSGIINILLNFYCIPIYGFEAAAYTTLASYFIMMVLSIFVTTIILKLPPLPFGRIVKYIVLLGGIVAINYNFGQPHVGLSLTSILFKGLLFLGLALLLYYDKLNLFINKPKDPKILDEE